MKRAAIATFALFFACSTAAIAQYEDRGQANNRYGQQENNGYSGMQRQERNQASGDTRSQNGIYQDHGRANATYGDRQAQNYGGSDRYRHEDRHGSSDRYRAGYSYRRHCVWHHDHRACYRWH